MLQYLTIHNIYHLVPCFTTLQNIFLLPSKSFLSSSPHRQSAIHFATLTVFFTTVLCAWYLSYVTLSLLYSHSSTAFSFSHHHSNFFTHHSCPFLLCPPTHLMPHTSLVHSFTTSLNISHAVSTLLTSPSLNTSYFLRKLSLCEGTLRCYARPFTSTSCISTRAITVWDLCKI